MSKYISVVALLAMTTFLFSQPASGQEKLETSIIGDLNKTPNMALGAKSERHIKGGIKIYEQLISNGSTVENFEIVIWGKVVKEITENPELFQFIEEHQHDNLRLSICQVAMEKLEVSPGELPEGITVVPNAWLRMLQLQAVGYNTLAP